MYNIPLSCIVYTGQAISPCPVYYEKQCISLSCILDKHYLAFLYTGLAISPCPVYRTSNIISLSCGGGSWATGPIPCARLLSVPASWSGLSLHFVVGVCHVAVGGWYHGGYTLCAAALCTVLWLFFVATCCGRCPGHVFVSDSSLSYCCCLRDQLFRGWRSHRRGSLRLMIQECGQLQLAPKL